MADEEIGVFYWHEALDRASIAADFVDEWLCEHPAVKSRSELLDLALTAQKSLADLYQKLGKIIFADE